MFKTIIIADDHDVVQLGITLLIESRYPDTDIRTAGSFFSAMELMAQTPAELLILDIQMPGMGIGKISEIKSQFPQTTILLFSGLITEKAIPYVRGGANGYISKYRSNDELITALETLFEKGVYFPAEIINFLLKENSESDPRKLLSEREYEIYELYSKGLGNLEITNELSIQPGTVSTYKRRILQKLKVKSIAELVKIYLKHDDSD